MWQTLVSIAQEALGVVIDGFKHKREIQRARVDAEVAMAQRRLEADISWDQVGMENQRTSWKDEWWTLVLAAPAIMLFIPALQPYAIQGFDALGQVPDWYVASLGVAIAAAFGYRAFADRMMNRRRQTPSA